MRLPIPLRRRAVLWLLPPAALLLVVVNNESRTSPPLPGLWAWTVGHSILLLIVPAAVAATGAALEAARLRARSLENAGNIRGPFNIMANAIWPSYVAGLSLQAIAVGLVATFAWGGKSEIPLNLIATIAAIVLFHTTAGFLMGSLVRPMLGVPFALALSYSWLGLTGTFEWFAPRHLAGLVLETCCFYDEQLNPLSALSAGVFSVLASCAFCLWAAFALRLITPRATVQIAAASLLALATSSGLVLASSLTGTAAEARNGRDLNCSNGDITVCLYPEQLALDDPTTRIEQMIQRVNSLDVAIPRRVVAGRTQTSTYEIVFRFVPGMTDAQIASSLASGFQAEQWLVCPSEPVERTVARQRVGEIARSWLALRFDGASSRQSEDADPAVLTLTLAPLRSQASWMTAALESMAHCEASIPEAPL